MRNQNVLTYKKHVNDWDKWIPPGGRMWYDRCTDPTENGFLVQLDMLINTLNGYVKTQDSVKSKASDVYMLTRKMMDNADSLFKMICDNEIFTEYVNSMEEAIRKQYPENGENYKLCDFIAHQKFYLGHITEMFHMISSDSDEYRVVMGRLEFYVKLKDVLEAYLDVIETCHMFNVIDNKLRKSISKEWLTCVSVLGLKLVGWDNAGYCKYFDPDQNVKDVMTKMFGYDIETSVLTDGLVELVGNVIKKHKEYVKLAKDLKYQMSHSPKFWDADNRLIIRDGSSDKAKNS